MKLFFRICLWLSLLSLVAFILILFIGDAVDTGPWLSLFFVLLALGIRSIDRLKGFSFTVSIFAAVTLAMYYPIYFQELGGFQLKKLIVPLMQIIMFGMGTSMSMKDFVGVIKMPKGVVVGLLCQFTIMPFVGLTLATVFGFEPEIAAGVVLIGSSPSGLASNVMTFIAGAYLALSVTLTAIATALAPLMTPLLMKLLAGRMVNINFWDMMFTVTKIVILPIVAGLLFNYFAHNRTTVKDLWKPGAIIAIMLGIGVAIVGGTGESFMFVLQEYIIIQFIVIVVLITVLGIALNRFSGGETKWLDKSMPILSMAGIAYIITIITAAGRDNLLAIGAALVVAAILHNSLGYLFGYWGSKLFRMDERSCRTIAIEVGLQNGGLASGIALEMGKVATMGLASAVFGPWMNISGSMLANFWRGRPVKDEVEPEVSAT